MIGTGHRRLWTLLACQVIVLFGAAILFIGWYRGYRDWHNSQAAPLFSDTEPADGATVYASDAWIRWPSPVSAKGRVLWRKAGGFRVNAADAGGGHELLAHLASLSADSKYEYIVEESDGTQMLRTPLRTLNVKSGLAFDPVAEQILDRDYDQTIKLTLRNRGSQPITVAARALKQYDDLPSDIAGYGSVEVPAQIAPNSALDLRLAVTAADATADTYEIPIEATGAYVNAKFHVRRPKFDLAFRVLSEDPKTLAKMVEIQNNGDALTDLSVRAAQENEDNLSFEPSIDHLRIYPREGVRFTVTPVLYLEFESLNANIEAHAAGQSTKFALNFKAPPGTRLIAFRSNTEATNSVKGHVCTNDPNTCSWTKGALPGNGPADSSKASPQNQIAKYRKRFPLPLLDENGSPTRLAINEIGGRKAVRPRDLHLRLIAQGDDDQESSTAPFGMGKGIPTVQVPCSDEQDAADSANKAYEKAEQDLEQLQLKYAKLQSQIDSNPEQVVTLAQQLITLMHQIENAMAAVSRDKTQVENANAALAQCEAQLSNPCLGKANVCKSPETTTCLRCADAAARLKAAYDAALYEYSKHATNPPDYLTWDLRRLIYYQLPKEWTELRKECCPCGDIGLLGIGSGPILPPAPPSDDFSKAAKAEYFDSVADQLDEKAKELDQEASDGLSISKLLEEVGVGTIVEQAKLRAEAKYLRDLANQYRQLADDPPAKDYSLVAVPHVSQTSHERTDPSTNAIDAIETETEYLRVFTLSFERYQGALVNNDPHLMRVQAEAMHSYADLIWQSASAAADVMYQIDHLFQDEMTQVSNQMALHGVTWKQVFAQQSQNSAMRSTFQDLYWSVTSSREQFQAANLVRERLENEGHHHSWPEPMDQLGLLRIRHLAGLADLNRLPLQRSEVRSRSYSGLLERLQRRATFTRSHRGAIIIGTHATRAGIEYHGEQRVYFAWNQKNDDIMFAAFESTGKPIYAPQLVGHGRSPSLSAEGQRIAIAWENGNGKTSTVLVGDLERQGKEITVEGTEPVVVFSAGEPVFIGSTGGLWQLNGNDLKRLQNNKYSQATISVDKQNKAHVAWVQDGEVVYDGADIGIGEHPSLLIKPDGTPCLSYIFKDSIVVRELKNGQWTPPDALQANKATWPTLALDTNGGVRLTYIGPTDYGPETTWLLRLPDKQPIMLPSLDGNVTGAWLTTTFNLNQARNHFRRHDLLVSVNDLWLKFFQNTVPEGRYLFPLNPNQVFTSSGPPVPNRIAIHSWHMNPGHYSENTGYQLGVRMSWSEHYVFASNEEEAKKSITSERVNHDQPDLGLFANAADLPIEMPKPGRINIPILIANLGEALSTPTRLVMYWGEGTRQELVSAPVPAIKQGEEKTIVMPLDYDGKMPSISFRLENNKDFDATNDELNLVLWEPLPTAYDGPDPNLSQSALSASTKFPLELKVTVAGQPVPQYKIVDAFTNRMFARVVNGEQYGSLRSGTYQVSVQAYGGEGQEVLFTQDIQHQAGALQEVDFKSGIRIEPPEVAQKLWRWGVSRADDPADTVQWQTGSHTLMVLPPGDYQIHSSAVGAENSWIDWPQPIRVQPNQATAVRIDNSVRLEMTTSLGNFWRWQLINSGRPDQVVASQSGDQREVIVPPGEYQLASSALGSENQWIIWPQKVEVQAGTGTVVKIDSSVHLDLAPELGNPLWRWAITRFGKPDQIIQSQSGDQRTVVLPPDDYQVISSAKGSENQWIVWPLKVQVRAGQQSTLRIDTSLRLNLPPEALNLLWQWQLIRFGRPDQKIQSQYGDQSTVVLPAGEYQVVTSAKGAENQWISWPQRITVQPGRQTEVDLKSGIRLTGPAAPGAQFRISDANGRTVQSWQGNAVQLLPPGKYTIEVRPDSASEWKRVGENAEVRAGGFTEVNVPSLPKSADQGNSGFHH